MIPSILRRAVSQYPDEVALEFARGTRTWGEVADRVSRQVGALEERGAGPGTRVAILSLNTPLFFEACFAAAEGRILVPLNVRSPPEGWARIIRHCGARLVLVGGEFEEQGRQLAEVLGDPSVCVVGAAEWEEHIGLARRSPPVDVSPDEAAQLYYTSGTTGEPKGVILTHRNVATHALLSATALGLTDRDVFAHVAPMFHLADAWATFAVTWVGGRHRLVAGFAPHAVLDELATGTTLTNLVPTMLSDLVHHPAARRAYPDLRLILSGGAPIAPALVEEIVQTFGCEYVQTYGLTETSPFLTMSRLPRQLGSRDPETRRRFQCMTGRPLAGVEVQVVRRDGTPVAADGTEVGEIRARGDTVTSGYWDNPIATAEALREGWLYTGDLAVLHPEGFLHIVDRKKDVILSGGESVYSTEVEAVLYAHSAIREAAAVGIPHPRWGEAVVAVIVPKQNAGAMLVQEVEQHCRACLGAHQRPKRVVVQSSLPRTGSGKIAKRLLRESLAGLFR